MAYVRLRSQRYYGENANVSDLRHIGNEKKAGSAFSQQGAVWTVLRKRRAEWVSMSVLIPGVVDVTSPVTKLKLILPASTYSLPRCGRSTLNASPCWEPAWVTSTLPQLAETGQPLSGLRVGERHPSVQVCDHLDWLTIGGKPNELSARDRSGFQYIERPATPERKRTAREI